MVEGVERLAAVDLELEAVVRSLVEDGCPRSAQRTYTAKGGIAAAEFWRLSGLLKKDGLSSDNQHGVVWQHFAAEVC